ncbi:MAG: ACP S-malonyltransferase [Actinomycetes bacterium]
MLAIIAPGQGSQTPGMFNSWIANPELLELLSKWSMRIDLDLLRLGTTADAEEIKDTANAQPLIVAASLLGAHALGIKNYSFTSGHSVGEIAAAAISGAISDEDALRLVRARGIEMAKAAAQSPAGMSAVLGGDRVLVLSTLAELNLVAANDNGAGQIVAAGDLAALTSLSENPPEGSRVRALAVAGAFHTSYMSPAVEPLRRMAARMSTAPTEFAVISNKDGEVVTDGTEVLNRIVNQIANPVRWDLCMDAMKKLGVTGVIELPPAGTLVGLLKRGAPEIETFALKSAEDLAAAKEFAGRHA